MYWGGSRSGPVCLPYSTGGVNFLSRCLTPVGIGRPMGLKCSFTRLRSMAWRAQNLVDFAPLILPFARNDQAAASSGRASSVGPLGATPPAAIDYKRALAHRDL